MAPWKMYLLHGVPELPWTLRVTLNRIRLTTAIDMRCNNKSSAEHAKVIVDRLMTLSFHGGYCASGICYISVP